MNQIETIISITSNLVNTGLLDGQFLVANALVTIAMASILNNCINYYPCDIDTLLAKIFIVCSSY